jgi:hypothetical protein
MSKPITMLDLCKAHPEKAAERIEALIKRNAELEKEAEEFKVVVSYLDAKIKSASNCHERAVPFLLSEALERTHLDFHRQSLKAGM